jgi:hypothetical protein
MDFKVWRSLHACHSEGATYRNHCSLMVEKKMFSNNGIEPWRPKNLLYESALKISFELKRQKTDRAFGNVRFFVGRLLRTEQ